MNQITLIGHNGAGKSTIIKYALGLYQKQTDHPYLKALTNDVVQINKNTKAGYAPETPLLEPNCSAIDYINWLKTLRECDDFDEIAQEIGFNVNLKKPIREYSKGMQQLLSLCLAFFGKPSLVVLDEPTSGLDPFISERVRAFILKRVSKQNLIVSTHSIDFAFDLKMQIWILKKGKIVSKKQYLNFDELKKDFWNTNK